MPDIIFQRTYRLSEEYESIKLRANQVLEKYLGYPGLYEFDDFDKSVTFSSERLIPTASTKRPRVMLLFSNPHPLSVHQGMFLSPNTIGQENLFWSMMEAAGWLSIEAGKRPPKQLADSCLNAQYPGPFELIFYCYYAFPTDFPEQIRKIFGWQYFGQQIEPDAFDEFKQTIQDTSVQAVLTFNKDIFNHVSNDPIERYIERLKQGELIRSQVKGIDQDIPIFLTYPTGWRYHVQYRQLRIASLETIMDAMCMGLNCRKVRTDNQCCSKSQSVV